MRRAILIVLSALLGTLLGACGGEIECDVGGEVRTFESCDDLKEAFSEGMVTQTEIAMLVSCYNDHCT